MQQRGFSLVELCIVLVILGLLTGGILSGQSLIRAAELRSVASDIQRYMAATNSFRDKYFAIPGDMRNATSFWDAQDSGDGLGIDCTDTPSTAAFTCNGDGDGRVGSNTTLYYYESFRFWHHLANAGLIEGRFSGVTGSGSGIHCVLGTNCPLSRLSATGFGILYYASSSAGQFVTPNSHQFLFGGAHTTNLPTRAAIRAEEAWNIDTKMDDGKPATGFVTAPNATTRIDCTSDDTIDASYMLTNTNNGCNMFFSWR